MMGPELLVGLDVGTTSSKAVVYGLDGAPLALGRAATPWRTVPRPAGSAKSATGTELDAYAVLTAARAAVSRALAGAPDGHVVGLGVTSMAESGVLLDSRGESVAPVIAWHDTRDADQVRLLDEEIGAEAFSSRTGLPYGLARSGVADLVVRVARLVGRGAGTAASPGHLGHGAGPRTRDRRPGASHRGRPDHSRPRPPGGSPRGERCWPRRPVRLVRDC